MGLPAEVPLAFPRPASSSVHLVLDSDLGALLPSMDAAAYKGTRGHVAVVGGAPGMSGALVLAARSAAAAASGAGESGDRPRAQRVGDSPRFPPFRSGLPTTSLPGPTATIVWWWVRDGAWGDDRVGLLETPSDCWKRSGPRSFRSFSTPTVFRLGPKEPSDPARVPWC